MNVACINAATRRLAMQINTRQNSHIRKKKSPSALIRPTTWMLDHNLRRGKNVANQFKNRNIVYIQQLEMVSTTLTEHCFLITPPQNHAGAVFTYVTYPFIRSPYSPFSLFWYGR